MVPCHHTTFIYLYFLSHGVIICISFMACNDKNTYHEKEDAIHHHHMYIILLNTLNPCLNYKFHFKGIKKNVLNNAIDFNFLSWISNAYIYVWQCSYNAFD
jgi:hypothetical protein